MTLFGTDGVRGVAGVDLTADLAASIAAAAVAELAPGAARPLVVVGRDPRPSGGWLQAAVVQGLTSAGADVALVGVLPTPAVARAVASGLPGVIGLPALGVVISASHNPAPDNGIKLFGAGGVKPGVDVESEIEARVLGASGPRRAVAGRVVADLSGDMDWYAAALLATLPGPLDGISVVVDCANCAAAAVAGSIYSRAGARVTVINDDASGERINENCGATQLGMLQAEVSVRHADVGIAHDGDADRCLAVSAAGDVVDGDAVLAILALDMKRRGALRGDAVAATVMSNLGLTTALRARGVRVVTTGVGDRQVIARMRADGLSLGGEQSGHIVLLDHATTGDGVLTALHLLAAVVASGRPLERLAAVVERLPQVLINVSARDPAGSLVAVRALVADAEAQLGDDGRVLVRASGTEPLVRVMVEATTEATALRWAQRIASAVR
jgi:phosphoglucosamine mutase